MLVLSQYTPGPDTVSIDGQPNDGGNCPQQCEGDNVLMSIENLNAVGRNAYRLTGSNGPNVINGSSGEDLIDGAGDGDIVHGSSGDDTLAGGAGDDALYGGFENDHLDGGPDTDECYGEQGTADTATNCESVNGVP